MEAIDWAFTQEIDPPTCKFVLVTLAKYADEQGRCWPSQATLAKNVRCSVITVRRYLARLEKVGLIQRQGRGGMNGGRTSDMYSLPIGSRGGSQSQVNSKGDRSPVNSKGVGFRSPMNGSNRSPINAKSPIEKDSDNRNSESAERGSYVGSDSYTRSDFESVSDILQDVMKLPPNATAHFLNTQLISYTWPTIKRAATELHARWMAKEKHARDSPGMCWGYIMRDLADRKKPLESPWAAGGGHHHVSLY